MTKSFKIGKRTIGKGHPVYIVAELSANHLQDFDKAIKLVRLAKRCGADAVKTQTYTPDSLTLRNAKGGSAACDGTIWQGTDLWDLYEKAYTPMEWQEKIRDVAHGLGMDFFSAAFSPKDIEFLEQLDVPIHKVASFEIVDIPLIEKMASTGKPMIIATGMATLEEIEEAVRAAIDGGAPQVALLKCTSSYPAKAEEMRLTTIPDLARRFKVPVGLSDHSMDITIPMAATALGASILEKHLTISRKLGGPDSGFSLEPKEFELTVKAVRGIEKALGEPAYGPTEGERASLACRRSLYAVRPIMKGERFTEGNVRSIRPAFGMHPRELKNVIGRKAKKDIKEGAPLEPSMVA